MLVLSRKSGEEIQIGDDITLTIVSVKGKRVRIGIEAPSDCRIVRGEIVWDSPNREEVFDGSIEAETELAVC